MQIIPFSFLFFQSNANYVEDINDLLTFADDWNTGTLPLNNPSIASDSAIGMKFAKLLMVPDVRHSGLISVTRLGSLLDFGQLFKAFGSN